ncbi:MAG: hypothetical protein ACI9R3_004404 [Verrucomicrobiales bacterium]|jgi:hypothetical protein
MPLTALQNSIFQIIKANRSPDSFVYGAITLHADDESPRYSRDIDISHDLADSVAKSAEADTAALAKARLEVQWLLRQPAFQRAQVSRGAESVVLEWVYDSAFRFFPVEEDDELGYRLHRFDIATNKMLALAGRSEPRDFVDSLYLQENYLSLGTLAWAAAGKDEGLNPVMILEMAERFAHYRQQEIDALALVSPLNIVELSQKWRLAIAKGNVLISKLPAAELGCAYLNGVGEPVTPDPDSDDFKTLKRHFGSVGGAWPRLAG